MNERAVNYPVTTNEKRDAEARLRAASLPQTKRAATFAPSAPEQPRKIIRTHSPSISTDDLSRRAPIRIKGEYEQAIKEAEIEGKKPLVFREISVTDSSITDSLISECQRVGENPVEAIKQPNEATTTSVSFLNSDREEPSKTLTDQEEDPFGDIFKYLEAGPEKANLSQISEDSPKTTEELLLEEVRKLDETSNLVPDVEPFNHRSDLSWVDYA